MKTALPQLCAVALAVLPSAAAAAQLPAYRDDRSTPDAVVASLYNAINRHEYLRAWSYFADGPGRPGYVAFKRGYEKTAGVRLKSGAAHSDGAAGSIYYALPVAIEARATDGVRTVFAGCYELRLIEPSIQDTPPFRPMGIVKGQLEMTTTPFAEATGSCTGMP